MTEPTVEAQLDELQRQSEARYQELQAIAAQLPAALSRRAVLRTMAVDFRYAPGKADVFRRALLKLARVPREAYTRIRAGFQHVA
jgi:hypothetical protein